MMAMRGFRGRLCMVLVVCVSCTLIYALYNSHKLTGKREKQAVVATREEEALTESVGLPPQERPARPVSDESLRFVQDSRPGAAVHVPASKAGKGTLPTNPPPLRPRHERFPIPRPLSDTGTDADSQEEEEEEGEEGEEETPRVKLPAPRQRPIFNPRPAAVDDKKEFPLPSRQRPIFNPRPAVEKEFPPASRQRPIVQLKPEVRDENELPPPRQRPTARPKPVDDDVKVFVPDNNHMCKFYLPFKVPRHSGSYKICTYDPSTDYWVSGSIKREGHWEGDLIGQALDYMSRARGSVSLVDVGCNIGVFTMSMAASGYRVVAVDAMDASLQLLATSLRLANLSSRVTLINNAISNKHELISMQVNERNIGGSMMVQGASGKGAVKAVCLDDLLPFVTTRKVFVKMDIERSEWLALQCADKFFEQLDVLYLMMEWTGYTMSENSYKGQIILDFMTKRGYRAVKAADVAMSLSIPRSSSWPGDIIWIKT